MRSALAAGRSRARRPPTGGRRRQLRHGDDDRDDGVGARAVRSRSQLNGVDVHRRRAAMTSSTRSMSRTAVEAAQARRARRQAGRHHRRRRAAARRDLPCLRDRGDDDLGVRTARGGAVRPVRRRCRPRAQRPACHATSRRLARQLDPDPGTRRAHRTAGRPSCSIAPSALHGLDDHARELLRRRRDACTTSGCSSATRATTSTRTT